MKSAFTFPVLLGLAVAGPAAADVQIHNATQSKVTAVVTLPNGDTQSDTLDAAVDSVDYSKWTFATGVKTVKLSLADDTGTSLWSGTVGANDTGVLVPAGKGVKYVPSGSYSGTSGWYAAALMNATEDSVTIDLVGRNGLAAHRGIAVGSAFDLKKVVKLDPRESTFSVVLKVKGAEAPIKVESSTVTPEGYYLLWKRSRDGAYRLLRLGNLPPPSKSKK